MVWLLLPLMLMGHLILVAHVQIQRCALGSRTDSASVQCLMLGETSFNVPGGGGGDAPVSQLLGLSTGPLHPCESAAGLEHRWCLHWDCCLECTS